MCAASSFVIGVDRKLAHLGDQLDLGEPHGGKPGKRDKRGEASGHEQPPVFIASISRNREGTDRRMCAGFERTVPTRFRVSGIALEGERAEE